MHIFYFIFTQSLGLLVICNNTKDNFAWTSEKMNVKSHKNCANTGKILKVSRVRCNFVKFDNHFRPEFSDSRKKFSLGLLQMIYFSLSPPRVAFSRVW